MKSIDDATPEEWDALNKRIARHYKNKPATPVSDARNHVYDDINKPEHYNNGSMECIDAIRGMLSHEEYIGYLRGNSLKYRWRFRYKGRPVEDLRKARWYEDRLLNYELEHPSEQLR
tara:strand:+ start:292 stop:642 length:351 start_codon:yes stop_codon:yes gene_type:complete